MGPKSGIGAVLKGAGEAVANPVKDEVGKMIETGVQSVVGTGQMQQVQTPDEQKKFQERQIEVQKNDAQKKQYWQSFLSQLAQNEQHFKQQQAEKQQEEQVVEQQEEQKKQQKEAVKQQKKDEAIVAAQTRTEAKFRHGA